MGILSITPSYEFAAHGLLPHGTTIIQDPHPLAGDYTGPRDGPRTSHFIWNAATGGAPLFPDVEGERLSQRATVDSRSTAQYEAERAARVARQQNRERVKRGLGAFARGVKRARHR